MKTKLTLASITILAFNIVTQLSICWAQNTTVTYQGRLMDNGTNFNGAGQFKFVIGVMLNTNTSASSIALPVQAGGVIQTGTYFEIAGVSGRGYTNAPLVTITGTGTGALATANLSGGSVVSITVTSGGSGYSALSGATANIAPPAPSGTLISSWSNDGIIGTNVQPAAVVSAAVADGLFTVGLGDTTVTNMASMPASLFLQPNLALQIWFNDAVNGFIALTPVQPLTAAPYAAHATSADAAGSLNGILPAAQISGMLANFNLPANPDFTGVLVGNGGGLTNINAATVSGLGAGNLWQTAGNAGTGAGTNFIGTTDNQPLEFHVNGSRALRLEPNTNGAPNVVGGASINYVAAKRVGATISGGGASVYPYVFFNVSYTNVITGDGDFGTIGGGAANSVGGLYATIPGGFGNMANGQDSFAAGRNAQALHDGAFVWGDSQGGAFSSTDNDQFCIRAQGGVQLDSTTSLFFGGTARQAVNFNSSSYGLGYQNLTLFNRSGGDFAWYENGAYTNALDNPGSGGNLLMLLNGSGDLHVTRNLYAGGVQLNSDRNLKQCFSAIQPAEVLAKVSALPITEWQYKQDTESVKHIGPMAQDFHAAFGLDGPDDKHISVVDEGGVALAAIQGLNQKLEQKETEITELKARLEKLEQLRNNQNGGKQ